VTSYSAADPANAIASEIYAALNGPRVSRQDFVGSTPSLTTSQPIESTLLLGPTQIAPCIDRSCQWWPVHPNTVRGLAASQHLLESWSLHPSLTPAAAANAASANGPTSSLLHDPDALLLHLLRACAAAIPAIADPLPGPQDPHILYRRLIHADAAAAALRLATAHVLAGWP
jgi:hypothetical protein